MGPQKNNANLVDEKYAVVPGSPSYEQSPSQVGASGLSSGGSPTGTLTKWPVTLASAEEGITSFPHCLSPSLP